jgi:type VI secretion system secreted protein Hcp
MSLSLPGALAIVVCTSLLTPAALAQVRARGQAAPQIAATPPESRAVDMYLKVDGIDGESDANDHRDWIEVTSWSWGNSSSSARQQAPVGNGQGTLTLVRKLDKASPKLSDACTSGRSLGQVVIHVRASGDRFDEYVIDDTRVRSCTESPGGDQPAESLTLNFSRVGSSTAPGGNPDRPVVVGR